MAATMTCGDTVLPKVLIAQRHALVPMTCVGLDMVRLVTCTGLEIGHVTNVFGSTSVVNTPAPATLISDRHRWSICTKMSSYHLHVTTSGRLRAYESEAPD